VTAWGRSCSITCALPVTMTQLDCGEGEAARWWSFQPEMSEGPVVCSREPRGEAASRRARAFGTASIRFSGCSQRPHTRTGHSS